jgi:hypothetical protein
LGSHFAKKSNSKNKKFNKELILEVSVARSEREEKKKKRRVIHI